MLVDGVSSQRLGDRSVALQRLAQSGAFLATSEMVGAGCWVLGPGCWVGWKAAVHEEPAPFCGCLIVLTHREALLQHSVDMKCCHTASVARPSRSCSK